MKKAYRLTPSLKDNIWGGNRLREYGKTSDAHVIAESWELSYVKGSESRLDDGRRIDEVFTKDAWGSNAERFEFFPVLTKFIDADDNLSVQVHPNDEYALKNEGSYGKTEMWYVVEAKAGAGLYMGLKRKCTPEEFRGAVADGTVENLLSFVPVKTGDVYFIPSGTVHAIGKGVLIFEIQQNSTLTYRLYDYMRRDSLGNLRELHVEKAMSVSTLDEYKHTEFDLKDDAVIGACDYFLTRKLKQKFTNTPYFVTKNSFSCLTCVEGNGEIDGQRCARGDSFFIPASDSEITINGEMTLIEVTVPEAK